MNPVALVLLLGWLWTFLGHGSYRSTLPLSYRIQNTVLSFLLIAWASQDLWSFWWRVFHPDKLSDFFSDEDFFPKYLGFVIFVLWVWATHLNAAIGFWMAQQNKRARTLVISVMPYLVVAQILEGIRTSSRFRPELVSMGIMVFVPLLAGFYLWLYLFCKGRQAQELMTNAF